MDICMKRADYEKFLRIYDKIMPENYTIYNITTDTETDDFLSRVINGRSINFDKIHLEKYHGFPYSAGIDIFPLDFIAPDEDDDKYQREVIDIVNTLAKTIRGMQEDESLMTEEAIADVKEDVKHIEKLCNITIDEDADLVQQLNILVDRLCGLYTEDESEYITLMPLWLDVNGIWRDGERYSFFISIIFIINLSEYTSCSSDSILLLLKSLIFLHAAFKFFTNSYVVSF